LAQKKKKGTISFEVGREEDEVFDGAERLRADAYFDGDEIQRKLEQAIQSLPDKQKMVFQLKYYEEMKYEDMSAILGTSVGALKASYFHAVKKIEENLKKD